MNQILFEIVLILILLIANGLFSLAEMAVVSARKVRLAQRAEGGDVRAQAALELANNPGDFLSFVQIGITLIGILAGAFGGASVARVLGEQFSQVPGLAPYSEALSLGLVVAVITYLSLIIGELVPKRLALNNPEQIAATLAGPMQALSRVASPLVKLLSLSTDLILKLFGSRTSTESPITEEEIKILIEQGTQAGVFKESEEDIVKSVFRFSDLQLGALMTPRPDITWLDLDDSPETNLQKIIQSGHSRFPVGQGGLDNALGIVRTKDMLNRLAAGEILDLKPLMRHPLFVPETLSGSALLEMLRQSRTHVALVVDEYGGVQGLVTIHDVLQAIVGDLPSRDDPAEPDAILREDGSWLIDGRMLIDEFEELFEIDKLPEEEKGQYQTVGGFVMMQLGHIPVSGERFGLGRWQFEVMDMDGKRVDKILVTAHDPQ